jgi:hypothetical protein
MKDLNELQMFFWKKTIVIILLRLGRAGIRAAHHW